MNGPYSKNILQYIQSQKYYQYDENSTIFHALSNLVQPKRSKFKLFKPFLVQVSPRRISGASGFRETNRSWKTLFQIDDNPYSLNKETSEGSFDNDVTHFF